MTRQKVEDIDRVYKEVSPEYAAPSPSTTHSLNRWKAAIQIYTLGNTRTIGA